MKSGRNFSRKEFLKTLALSSLILPVFQYCSRKSKTILLKITSTNHILGHRIWAKNFPGSSETIQTKILIIGSGVTALSAARSLRLMGINDITLVEMEQNLGGNSSSGENQWSKFPLGAHYLPFPNKDNSELIAFLEEQKIVLGYDEKKRPILDEEQITFPPHDRLHHKNSWEEQLYPIKNLDNQSSEEFERFFYLMNQYKQKRDELGAFWFDIPIEKSSQHHDALILEEIAFSAWLTKHNFHSEALMWYLNYCCKDDYGLGVDYVSAWAGIHYFAGRKGDFAPHYNASEFTWPEGNARLIDLLGKFVQNKVLHGHLAFDVKLKPEHVEVLVFDSVTDSTKTICAQKVLFCTPQYVNQYLFKGRKASNFKYAPWFIATLVIDKNFAGCDNFAWDNAIYMSDGLGYIYNQHQNINQVTNHKVISFYYSFNEENLKNARKKLFKLKDDDMKEMVLKDLRKAHYFIEDYIVEMQFHKLGHGMIAPVPKHIFGEKTAALKEPIDQKIYFAHSDLSGISIFEESFHQGISVVKKLDL
jgi:hypothetical protein